jgi:nicotinamidase-related amidase
LNTDVLLSGQPQEAGPGEWVMFKPRWGAFYRTTLEERLRALDVDTVVICGCNFPNCPRTTIYEASERDLEIIFVSNATSGVYERGLEELRSLGVVVLDTDECLSWLRMRGQRVSRRA